MRKQQVKEQSKRMWHWEPSIFAFPWWQSPLAPVAPASCLQKPHLMAVSLHQEDDEETFQTLVQKRMSQKLYFWHGLLLYADAKQRCSVKIKSLSGSYVIFPVPSQSHLMGCHSSVVADAVTQSSRAHELSAARSISLVVLPCVRALGLGMSS